MAQNAGHKMAGRKYDGGKLVAYDRPAAFDDPIAAEASFDAWREAQGLRRAGIL